MSPRSSDPALRAALIEAAAQILASEGPRALTTRRLAAEVGASTMAVYTRFGSMDEVRRAVRREGFARLEAALDSVTHTDDPVADLATGGAAYFANGLAHPAIYRAMFVDRPPDGGDDPGSAVFVRVVEAVRRCIDAGRFDPTEPTTTLAWAAEIWALRHGVVTLALSDLLPLEQVSFLLADGTYRLAVGYGDRPATADDSIERGHRSFQARPEPGTP